MTQIHSQQIDLIFLEKVERSSKYPPEKMKKVDSGGYLELKRLIAVRFIISFKPCVTIGIHFHQIRNFLNEGISKMIDIFPYAFILKAL